MIVGNRGRPARYGPALLILGLLVVLPFAVSYIKALNRVERFSQGLNRPGTVLLDAQGNPFETLGNRRRTYVQLDELPAHLPQAVIAIEDSRFYRHFGIDPIGILRALYVNLRQGAAVQGGSTITQQLAKNLFLTPRKTLARKVEEAMLAIVLEQRYSKNKILELYLNEVYFGEGAYGIDAASRTYFGKAPGKLVLHESALLASILRAPTRFSPFRDRKAARQRRDLVLDAMREQKVISAAEAVRAKNQELQLAEAPLPRTAPYFTQYVEEFLLQRFGRDTVYKGGLRVQTTLDLRLQGAARIALGNTQGAIVALDPNNGHIKALVGGRDFQESQFNRATKAHRQPGSAFKPFVYVTALTQGWRQNTIVQDIPRDFNGYRPRNFADEYWGPVTLKHALVRSLNTAAVWTLNEIGIDAVISTARRFGITSLVPQDRHLALALGGLTQGVTPLELATAYLPFSNGGLRFTSTPVSRVEDSSGRTIFTADEKGTAVITEEVAFLMTDIMIDVIRRGTGTEAQINRPAAGKTGTTDRRRSLWFVGYTPGLLAAVYVGNDNNEPLAAPGGQVAAPIWAEFMKLALENQPVRDFQVPENIVTGIPIDIFTGQPPGPGAKFVERDAFIRGTEPKAGDRPSGLSKLLERLFPARRPPQPPPTPSPKGPSIIPPQEPEPTDGQGEEEPPEQPQEPPTPEPEPPVQPDEPQQPGEQPEQPEPGQPEPEQPEPMEPEPEQPPTTDSPPQPKTPPTEDGGAPSGPETPQPEPPAGEQQQPQTTRDPQD